MTRDLIGVIKGIGNTNRTPTLINNSDYENHINYTPVKHGYINKVIDWSHSTLHDYIASGVLPRDWGFEENNVEDITFGESI